MSLKEKKPKEVQKTDTNVKKEYFKQKLKELGVNIIEKH